MTTIGKTPQNQIDALPIIDVTQAANPGQVQIIGNVLTKFWNNTDLGMSVPAAGWGNAGAQIYSISNTLDLRGLASLQLVMKRVAGAGAPQDNPIGFLVPVFNDLSFGPINVLAWVNTLQQANASYVGGAGPSTQVLGFMFAQSFSSSGLAPWFTALSMGFGKLAIVGFGAAAPNTVYTYDLWGCG